MAAWRYEFSLLEEKFRISARPCNIVYFPHVRTTKGGKVLHIRVPAV